MDGGHDQVAQFTNIHFFRCELPIVGGSVRRVCFVLIFHVKSASSVLGFDSEPTDPGIIGRHEGFKRVSRR